jgi:hypothetical protein
VPSATCFHQTPRQVRRTHVAEQGPSRRCMGAARSYSRAGRHHKCSGQSLIQLCRERLPAALPVDVRELNQIVSTLTNAIRVCLQPAAMRDMTRHLAQRATAALPQMHALAPRVRNTSARERFRSNLLDIEARTHRLRNLIFANQSAGTLTAASPPRWAQIHPQSAQCASPPDSGAIQHDQTPSR